MPRNLIGTIQFAMSLFLEPTGIGLKAAALGLLIAQPTWMNALLLFIATTAVAVSFTASVMATSETAMRSLKARIEKRPLEKWYRNAPFTTTELREFGLRQFCDGPKQRGEQLFFVSYEGCPSIDTVCYFNVVGSSFVFTANAGKNLVSLSPKQRFIILHEIGHASFAGGEIWASRIEAGFVILAIVVACAFTVQWPWWACLFSIGGGVFLLGLSQRAARDEKAETFADRYALRQLAVENVGDALAVAESLLSEWQGFIASRTFGTRQRELELRARVMNLKYEISSLGNLAYGKASIDYNRMPSFIREGHYYAWAATIFLWVWLHSSVDSASTAIATVGFAIILHLAILAREKSRRQIKLLEQWILEKCQLKQGDAHGE